MKVTIEELENDIEKFIHLSAIEDVFVIQHGRVVSMLTNPHRERVDTAESLFGILQSNETFEEVRAGRFGEMQE